MQNATTLGTNMTGAQMSPLDMKKMTAYAEQCSPPPDEDLPEAHGIAAVRSDYIHEADTLGSVPLPGTVTGAVTTGMAKITGKNPEVLIDKLGERLAFERTGVRLYQAFIDKVSAMDSGRQPLPFEMEELEEHRDQELEHMHRVAAALESLGADPTAQTPCADTVAVASSGIIQVLTDPRTTLAQSLTALLTAELADQASWELLIRLCEEAGQKDLVPGFQAALETETEHAEQVRDWLSQAVLKEAA